MNDGGMMKVQTSAKPATATNMDPEEVRRILDRALKELHRFDGQKVPASVGVCILHGKRDLCDALTMMKQIQSGFGEAAFGA